MVGAETRSRAQGRPSRNGSRSVAGASRRLALASSLFLEHGEHLLQLLVRGEKFAYLREIAALIRVMLGSESTEAHAHDAFGPRRVGHFHEIAPLEFGFNGSSGLAAAVEEPFEVFPGNVLKIFTAQRGFAIMSTLRFTSSHRSIDRRSSTTGVRRRWPLRSSRAGGKESFCFTRSSSSLAAPAPM
jgi:hypothetical protein